MFTLKIYHQHLPTKLVVSAAKYDVYEAYPETCIYVYPTLKDDDCELIKLNLDSLNNAYYEVFIENSSGKTIDRYRARSE